MTGARSGTTMQVPRLELVLDEVGAATGLVVARAWPREPQRLDLELCDRDGRVVAARWQPPTDGRPGLRVHQGCDPRLPHLVAVLRRPGAALVAHRVERRAVVRVDGPPGQAARWVKLARLGRTTAAVAAARAAARHSPLRTPRLRVHRPEHGLTEWDALPGTSLRELLAEETAAAALLRPAAAELGRGMRELHGQPVRRPQSWPVRTAQHDGAWVSRWVRRLRGWWPQPLAAQAEHAAARVRRLLDEPHGPPVPIHADLHDGQVLVEPHGLVGVLDWDTFALGEAASDLANLLAHLEVRVLTGECSSVTAQAVAGAFLRGYELDATVRRRLPAHLAALRLRLACSSWFRPARQPAAPLLLERLEAPGLGLER